jgi:hypothetical protein
MKSKMFSFIAAKAVVAEKTFLESTQLTEVGALRMLLFLHLQMLRVAHPALSAVFSKRYSAGDGKYVLSLTPWRTQRHLRGADWADNSALAASTVLTILQLAEALAAAERVPENLSCLAGLSHSDFLRNGLRGVSGESARGEGVNGMTLPALGTGGSAIDALLQLGGELAPIVRQALQEMARDVLFSSAQVRPALAVVHSCTFLMLNLPVLHNRCSARPWRSTRTQSLWLACGGACRTSAPTSPCPRAPSLTGMCFFWTPGNSASNCQSSEFACKIESLSLPLGGSGPGAKPAGSAPSFPPCSWEPC